MSERKIKADLSRQAEDRYLSETLDVVRSNVATYGKDVSRMKEEIDEMLEHYHEGDVELWTLLNNTITFHDNTKRALERNEKALNKPYFGRVVFHDEKLNKEESLYIGRGGISKDTTNWMVVDWRAPVANVYYENGLGKCSYLSPEGTPIHVDLLRKRTYEIEKGELLEYFDSEVIANDELLTKYLAKNKQAVLGEIVATIQAEQNAIIRKSPYHNVIVQGVAGSGKTTVAMHRISYILYNYAERFKPDDFYIVGSNRILLNYITGVLPDLDVYGVRQMTMEQLFVRLLYEDWDEEKYRIRSIGNAEIVKGSSAWYRDLQNFCRELEWTTIPKDSVYLNPKGFVEGIRDGKAGVYDESNGETSDSGKLVLLMDGEAVKRYIRQNPTVSLQSKIDMLNSRLLNKIKEEFLIRGIKYTEAERKAILRQYRGQYGPKEWKTSIYDIYRDFLLKQKQKGYAVSIPEREFDVYDLAALAYIYKRIKETEVISEAHHVVIDEAQDFGMMAYSVLKFCIKDCTYTVMGDVSQNIHFGFGLNDWEELKELLLSDEMDSFCVLKKSYRNTVEISEFATMILNHGQFPVYPVEPIIRHGDMVKVWKTPDRTAMIRAAARICSNWQRKGYDTIAVVCRDEQSASIAAEELSEHIEIVESDLEKTEFGAGVMVLPVEYTKGLEFDAVLILDPDREDYPVDDGHAKLLYVAATRALHQLNVVHTGNLTGLIADPVPEKRELSVKSQETKQEEAKSSRNAKSRISIVMGNSEKPEEKTSGNLQKDQPGSRPAVKPRERVAARPSQEKKPTVSVGKPRSVVRPTDAKSGLFGGYSELQRSIIMPDAYHTTAAESQSVQGRAPSFGDMPSNEILRPMGHAKIDLAVRWADKRADGLYLSSRYGVLRLSPLMDDVIRITFARGSEIRPDSRTKLPVAENSARWMYKALGNTVELTTNTLCLSVDKNTGAIQYMTRDKKVLLAERKSECRQIESAQGGRCWLYLDWAKNETIQAVGVLKSKRYPNGNGTESLKLNGSARYISHNGENEALPLLLSDKGYALMMALDLPTLCCNISTYGSYLAVEGTEQLDFYFMLSRAAGKLRFQ